MKAVFARTLVMLAGVMLIVPFMAVALLVGARAAAGAQGTGHRLLLAALAFGGALYSAAKGFSRPGGAARITHALRVPSRAREAGARLS